MKKLKQSEVKKYRENMLKDQGGKCVICCQPCIKPCLEHAHTEPNKDKIRGVACRTCNIYEGKLRNASVRTGGGLESLKHFAPRVYDYITYDYSLADWHPSKRKSELIAFKKLTAGSQIEELVRMGADRRGYMSNQVQRSALFKKLNAKT